MTTKTTPTILPTNYVLSELISKFGSKSNVIRYLSAEGLTRSDICKVFHAGGDNIRYQHVRNVLIHPLKKK